MGLDGASDSRPALETVQEHHATPKLEHKPTKLRRFMSIGSRGSKLSSRVDTDTKPGNTTPLQILSPRPTELEPRAKKHTKRSISTFLLSKTSSANDHEFANDNSDTGTVRGHVPAIKTTAPSLPAAAARKDECSLGSQEYPLVPAKPRQSVQTQQRKDSVTKSFHDVPLSASRTAALTSHPVGKEDLDSEEYKTPREFGERQMEYRFEK